MNNRCSSFVRVAFYEAFDRIGVLSILAAAGMNLSFLSELHTVVKHSAPVSFLTPFLFIWCSPRIFPSPHFFMSAFMFFSLSRYPKAGSDLIYHIVRMNRIKWIACEIASMLLYIFAFTICQFMLSIFAMLPFVTPSVDWGEEILILLESAQSKWNGGIPYAIIYQLKQTDAFALTIVLWLLYCAFGELVILVTRLLNPRLKFLGIGLFFGLYFYDYICEYSLPYVYRYFSPVALSRMSYLNLGFDPSLPPIRYSMCFYLICITLFTCITVLLAKHVNIDDLSSRTYQ